MVGTYTPSIAPLEAPVSDCGMGLGGAEASTARRNEVWRRGVVGGRYIQRPSKLVTKKLKPLRLKRHMFTGEFNLAQPDHKPYTYPAFFF